MRKYSLVLDSRLRGVHPEKLSGVCLEVEEVEYEGSKECRKDEENKPEPILEAKYTCDRASEAG